MKLLSFLLLAFSLTVFSFNAKATSSFSGPTETRTIGGCTKIWNSNVYVLTAAVGDNTHYQSAVGPDGAVKLDASLKFCICGIRAQWVTAGDYYGVFIGYSTNSASNATSAPTGWTQFNPGSGFLDGGNLGVSTSAIGSNREFSVEIEIPANKYVTIATTAGSQGPTFVEILGEYKSSCH